MLILLNLNIFTNRTSNQFALGWFSYPRSSTCKQSLDLYFCLIIWVFPTIGVPHCWLVYNGTLLKWMIWGVPYFWKHPYEDPQKIGEKFNHSPASSWRFLLPHPICPISIFSSVKWRIIKLGHSLNVLGKNQHFVQKPPPTWRICTCLTTMVSCCQLSRAPFQMA